ncbi:MAG: phospholipase D-like domain-containing protein [Micropruina sp.]|uniref:phospholipase D-like domain-containing protein n=1 Tax=Micropruina sp. TaxID=2737536 RepID=UPI0039E336FF
MRYRSRSVRGIRAHAVCGVNTVSFALTATEFARKGLLGFCVERAADGGPFLWLRGFKVFRSLVPDPQPDDEVSTYTHPIQALVWDDFTLRPDTSYTYRFHPMRGTPAKPRRNQPITITIRTEPLLGGVHDVVFNRGVASSQAYQRRFGGKPPDQQPTPQRRQEALDWLSRDLDDVLLGVIRSAGPGDSLRGAFYEFNYRPVLDELVAATGRGVEVRLVVDFKEVEGGPRTSNAAAIAAAGFPPGTIVERTARVSAIAHNKFLVLARADVPEQVWTGSTNLTMGGVHGQSNVGHLITDAATARVFTSYWELLATDPGGRRDDSAALKRSRNAAFKADVATLSPAPADRAGVASGITPVFSPRPDLGALQLYARLIGGDATSLVCATFAFGIAQEIADAAAAGTPDGPLRFFLLETRGTATVRLDASRNVYQAWGSELNHPLGRWVAETTTRELGLNRHVAFIHDKFLLCDPLGPDPVVVTGSANFSRASTTENDENMVIVRGDRRTADIYFTEFNRLFFHYYFRSVVQRVSAGPDAAASDQHALDMVEDDSWTAKYAPGTLRAKRVAKLAEMADAQPG